METHVFAWKLSPEEVALLRRSAPDVSLVELGGLPDVGLPLTPEGSPPLLIVSEEEQATFTPWADDQAVRTGILPSPVLLFRRQTDSPPRDDVIAYFDEWIDASHLLPFVERTLRSDHGEAERAAEDVHPDYLRRITEPTWKLEASDLRFSTPERDRPNSVVRRSLTDSPLFRLAFERALSERLGYRQTIPQPEKAPVPVKRLLLEIPLLPKTLESTLDRLVTTFVAGFRAVFDKDPAVSFLPLQTSRGADRTPQQTRDSQKEADLLTQHLRAGLTLIVAEYQFEVLAETDGLLFWRLYDARQPSERSEPFRLEFTSGNSHRTFDSKLNPYGGEQVFLSLDDWWEMESAGGPITLRVIATAARRQP
ncbi:MAG: hypothetical protein V4671_15475 [Armatimonadota bacterium]